ncbi:MAG: photosystem II cytochrome PsbV2 [Leptolyngbyaceae cyanobacterium SL_7_1]|nr:photosystem II cytochrome PsbV2 [Leptolyngbyaceae cyanobacterium SL_7_1]
MGGWWKVLGIVLVIWAGVAVVPVQAADLDPYVVRYLRVTEAIELPMTGDRSQSFSPVQLSEGKRLFEGSCKNCHLGGATLPDPTAPLSLDALRGATPPRDTIAQLVAFMRQPMTYDGTEESVWCRQVPDTWMSQAQVENLAAFILRAAEKAPGWGTADF